MADDFKKFQVDGSDGAAMQLFVADQVLVKPLSQAQYSGPVSCDKNP